MCEFIASLLQLLKMFVLIILTLSQNAKRAGHGAPKNMIGSRGADKVAFKFISASCYVTASISL